MVDGEEEAPYARLVSDSMSRWMPDARRVVIAGGGHGVHLAEPGRFNEALQEFLHTLSFGEARAVVGAAVCDADHSR